MRESHEEENFLTKSNGSRLTVELNSDNGEIAW